MLCVHVCVYVCVCVCVCACMRACVHVCERVHIYVFYHNTDLGEKIQGSYTPMPEVIQLHMITDYKQHLESHATTICSHSKPLCFKFQLDDKGKALLDYRECTGMAWKRVPTPLLEVRTSVDF